MNQKQYSFSEMSRKIVINVADGRELGHVCDMIFNNCGGIMGFIVPGKKSLFKSITSSDNIFIPWNRIIKIGSDVILVELVQSHRANTFAMPQEPPSDNSRYTQSGDGMAEYPEQYTCPNNTYPQAEQSAQTVYHTDER